MKPIMAGRTTLIALLAFCVTGCASVQKSISGHMAPDDAAEYASMSPEEFVKTRFYTEDLGILGCFSAKLGQQFYPSEDLSNQLVTPKALLTANGTTTAQVKGQLQAESS